MSRGWLVYNQEDYKKNKVYAKMLIEYGQVEGLEIQLLIRETLVLEIGKAGLIVSKEGQALQVPEFVINRSRDVDLAKHLEYMGVKVFNSSQVTEVANDKGRSHQFVNRLGIPSMPTLIYDKRYMKVEDIICSYPVVIKSVDGHGGEEVYKATNQEEAKACVEKIEGNKGLIQNLCGQVGVDVRVFVIANQIVGAIKRTSKTDFRSNYSLGGSAEVYCLNEAEQALVTGILSQLHCDFVGIDFMIDEQGQFIFNEIEDVVGSRTLYTYTEIDSAKLYIRHIKNVSLKRK